LPSPQHCHVAAVRSEHHHLVASYNRKLLLFLVTVPPPSPQLTRSFLRVGIQGLKLLSVL
jgi:hypothetical protein